RRHTTSRLDRKKRAIAESLDGCSHQSCLDASQEAQGRSPCALKMPNRRNTDAMRKPGWEEGPCQSGSPMWLVGFPCRMALHKPVDGGERDAAPRLDLRASGERAGEIQQEGHVGPSKHPPARRLQCKTEHILHEDHIGQLRPDIGPGVI